MTDAAAPQPRTRGRWRVWLISAVAVVVVVGGIAALGGFNDVPVEDLPELSLGDTHHGNEVDTVVTSVYLATRVPGREYEAEEGTQYLLVTATLLNTTEGPAGLTTDLVRVLLDGQISGNDQANALANPRTGGQVGFLQPGIPVHGVFFWEVDDTVKAGDDIIIGLFDRFPVDDPRFDGTAYTNPTPTARILTTIGAAE